MTDAERIAARLSPAQRKAIYPGPGNPEYAKGRCDTMTTLLHQRLVWAVSFHPDRSSLLTPLGREVRAVLAREARDE